MYLQILVYDIRSDKPLLVKDHHYGLPIKCIDFSKSQNAVLSMDHKIVKIWDNDTVRHSIWCVGIFVG